MIDRTIMALSLPMAVNEKKVTKTYQKFDGLRSQYNEAFNDVTALEAADAPRGARGRRGRFRLLMEVGSRQWGGGEVRWRVGPHVEQPRRTTVRDVESEILQVISDHPFELTKTQIVGQLGGKKGDRDAAFARMELNGVITAKAVALPDASGQARTRTRWEQA